MKFLKPLLFSLLVTCAVQAEEHVLKLSNTFGKHTVSENCEIEFHSNTLGQLCFTKTIKQKQRGSTSISLPPNAPISFYWQQETSSLWTITSNSVSHDSYRKNGSTSEFFSLQDAASRAKIPETVAKISQCYLDEKSANALPGLHITNILGEHALGNISVTCFLDTKGKMSVDRKGSASLSNYPVNEKFFFYHDSKSNLLWKLTSSNIKKERLKPYRQDTTELSAESLKWLDAPAKVIELAKELNPSL